MSERVQLVNIRTGEVVWEGTDYVDACHYRRDVLTPRLANPWKCPWHVIYPDDPDYIAAQADFAAFCAQAERDIAALPKPMVQGELFGLAEFYGEAS